MNKTIRYADTEAFYKELRNCLECRDDVTIETPFERFQDVPQKLRDIFELERHKSDRWVNMTTNAFVPRVTVASGMNLRGLYVFAGAAAGVAVGAGIGSIAGGVGAGPGAAVGAVIGTISGAVAAAVNQEKFDAEVEISNEGKAKIKISYRD